MKSIDKDVLATYNSGAERNRLRTGIGLIEFERSRELLREYLPPAPATVYDIGGGYGEYAWWLSSLGYQVHLFDLAQTNIAMSTELSAEYPGCQLKAAEVADARNIDRPSGSADAVLCMGPLYHIAQREERLAALNECARLLRPGGVLCVAAITRYATLLWATTVFGAANRLLEEDAFMQMVETELRTGEHVRPADSAYRGIGRSHFHAPDELKGELSDAGFKDIKLHGVVGCGWLAPNLDALWQDDKARAAIMRAVRLLDGETDVIGLSTHLLAICQKH
ncbi:MAG TPA: methyltransferase domain-containing protein [Candidatus Fimadaptatus faecigallinarum]|uniref:Methyltransferase domain-containing protein n=1 Tax=Candidatus Fimadaptatus faecigallinarum TaxID=2840814 RepID=A0A9D1LSS9_9FIRM|nr:methyltransferase domain-containing protein [Candidatus Fimadaptatus faecigallinarum]